MARLIAKHPLPKKAPVIEEKPEKQAAVPKPHNRKEPQEKKETTIKQRPPRSAPKEKAKNRSRVRDTLKTEIAQTTKRLLAEGLTAEKITMNLIAERMGITAPTLYGYFKGKEDILLLSLEIMCDELLETLETPLPATMNQEMHLQMRIVTLMTYLHKNYNAFPLLFSEAEALPGDADTASLTEKIQKFRTELDRQVRQYLEAGKIKIPSSKTTLLLLSLMMGYLDYFRDQNSTQVDINKESEVVYTFFKNGLKK